MSDQWGYTVEEVAAVLRVNKHTVLRRAKELGAVQIAGTIPQTRRARADWEETATRKLAEIARANSKGVPERAVLARIARNARTLCFVNREEAKDVVFVEGED